MSAQPPANLGERLREHGLRPTKQRLAVARLLLEGADRHVSAEQVYRETREAGHRL
jgi:Fur family transcriptional regulator, iron response regulator